MKHIPSNLKKISIAGGGMLLFIVILNAVFGLFRYPFIAVSPFEAIPKHSAFIIETTDDLKMLQSGLNGFDGETMKMAESIRADQEVLEELLGNAMVGKNINTLVIPQVISAAKIDFLYVLDFQKTALNSDSLRKVWSSLSPRHFNYSGMTYQSMRSKSGKELSLCQFRNLVLVSKYPVLIEDGIRQLQNYRTNINLISDFKKIYHKEKQTLGAKLYINGKEVPRFLSSFFHSESRNQLNALPNFANWISMDLKGISQLKWNGYLSMPEANTRRNKPSNIYKTSLLKAIPDNTGLFYASSITPLQVPKDSVFKQFIAPWFLDEWSFSIINPRSSMERLLVLKSKDTEHAKHYLDRYGRLFGELKTRTYQTYPLMQLADDALLDPFLNQLQLDLENPYYTIIDDLVVFTKTRQSLELIIDKYIVGQNILSNDDFAKYVNGLSDESNTLLYFDVADVAHILKESLISELHPLVENWMTAKKESITGGFEWYNGRDILPLKADFDQEEMSPKQTDIVWRVALSGKVSSEPKLLWNPATKAYEIIVQDDLNNLYLLNNNGEIIWKRSLKEPMLSDIHQVDYQENGSSQLFFNTANKIYLIDRQGKDIGNYPLRLQSPATNGMCVVDFKHDLQYKIFIACENGHAYGFTKEGNPVFGWNPKMKVGRILQPFQHFQYNGTDYLVILNDKGKLATYNSIGKSVYPELALGASYINSPKILSDGKHKEIALANNEGQLKIVDSKGRAYNLSMDNKEQEDVKLTFANITGDTKMDLVALSKNKVTGYYQDKKQLKQHFEVIMNHEQDEVFEVKSFKDKYSYFGTLCKSKKQINLFNANSILHKDFPLAGTTAFKVVDLYKNNTNILVVGLDNEIYAYRIAKAK